MNNNRTQLVVKVLFLKSRNSNSTAKTIKYKPKMKQNGREEFGAMQLGNMIILVFSYLLLTIFLLSNFMMNNYNQFDHKLLLHRQILNQF